MLKPLEDVFNAVRIDCLTVPRLGISLSKHFTDLFAAEIRETGVGGYKSVEFGTDVACFESANGKVSYVPMSGFLLAYKLSAYYEVLKEYRDVALSVFDQKQIKDMREKGLSAVDVENVNKRIADENDRAKLLDFLSHYDLWGGGKTIDRTDFFVSPLMKCASLQAESQSAIAELAQLFHDNKELYNSFSYFMEDNKVATTQLQKIFYGAPGTGKSFKIKTDAGVKEAIADKRVFRTTFHPDSDYSTFVGAYKPTIKYRDRYDIYQKLIKDSEGKPVQEDYISYEFVEQAFIQAYVKAWECWKENKNVYLVVEEINRGNCAQIFGDTFQLLDRNSTTGYSDYEIHPDKDLQKHLKEVFRNVEFDDDYLKVKNGEAMILPPNLFIWATMNTSDQSLFPIDSAFKRRWDWQYVPIADMPTKNWTLQIGSLQCGWYEFLAAINEKIFNLTRSHDKQLGYFFVKTPNGIINEMLFLNKVLFYLWNDVFRDFADSSTDFLQDDDKKMIEFTSFITSQGDVNVEKVQSFLVKLGVILNPMAVTKKTEDDTEIVDENGNTDEMPASTKDYTHYTLNGEGDYTKRGVVLAMFNRYVAEHPQVSVDEFLQTWKSVGRNGLSSRFVIAKEEYETLLQTKKPESIRSRYQRIDLQAGGCVYVSNQYGKANIPKLIENLNQSNIGYIIAEIA